MEVCQLTSNRMLLVDETLVVVGGEVVLKEEEEEVDEVEVMQMAIQPLLHPHSQLPLQQQQHRFPHIHHCLKHRPKILQHKSSAISYREDVEEEEVGLHVSTQIKVLIQPLFQMLFMTTVPLVLDSRSSQRHRSLYPNEPASLLQTEYQKRRDTHPREKQQSK